MAETNPNGANQYQLDPRQQMTWKYYIDVNGETFGNAYASAIKAGYEDDTARNITLSNWFKVKKGRFDRIEKAEKVFDEILEMDAKDPFTDKIDSGLMRVKLDASKFVAEKTSDEYNPKTKVDLTSKGEQVVGFNIIVPDLKEDNI